MAIGWLHSAGISSAGVQIKVKPTKMLTSIEEKIELVFGNASNSDIIIHILGRKKNTDPKYCYSFITR
jgi:hypothetical protein